MTPRALIRSAFQSRLVTLASLISLFAFGAAAQRGQAADPKAIPRGPKKFFVIAPERFHSALEEFVEYKRLLRATTLVSLEKILKSSQGIDDPERLKRFLFDAWRRERLGYVLLVGDVDVMPVRFMVLDRVTPAAFDYAFYPSDLYYADLARRDGSFDDWNAMKQGFHRLYFGEVRGEKNKKGPINFDQVDYRPKIAFGRWPVSTEKEVQIVADKTIAYERSIRDGTHPGLRRADFFNTAGYVDVRDRMNGWVVSCRPAGAQGAISTRMTNDRITLHRPTRPTLSKQSIGAPRSSPTSGTAATTPGPPRFRRADWPSSRTPIACPW